MKKILILLFFLTNIVTQAQEGILLKEINKSGSISFAKFHPDSSVHISQSEILLNKVLRLKTEDKFNISKTETDNIGITHQFYNQYYKGIKVALELILYILKITKYIS